MVQHGKLDFLCVSFLIAGHTKFLPDLSFAKIAKDYNRSDVFNTQELKDVIALHADVVVDQGEIVCDWRTKFDAQILVRRSFTAFGSSCAPGPVTHHGHGMTPPLTSILVHT